MTWNRLAVCLGFALVSSGCGDTIEQTVGADGGPRCSADTTVLCICPGPAIGEQICEGGAPGGCDCSNPIKPGECNEDGTAAACICADDQIGEQTCVDGVPGDCACPDPIPAEQCRTDLDCSDGRFCNGVERCDPDADGANGRGCTKATNAPVCDDGLSCTIDSCSNERDRCVFDAPDADGDGHRDSSCVDSDGQALGDDCDDDDANRYPGNREVCSDGSFDHDEDCDDSTFGLLDVDGDGATDDRCCNGSNCGTDCDDTTIARRVGQPEFCDNADNDCDGTVDENAGAVPWHIDADGDGFGVITMDDVLNSCIPIPGRSLLPTDCNDSDPSKHPAQLERCDLRDNNCNLIADENALCPYEPFAVLPDSTGGVDVPGPDACPPWGYEDLDGDGFGNSQSAIALDPDVALCGLPADWVTKAGDCDDTLANRNPGEVDVCDNVDNDCDDVVDQEPEASESCNIANIDAMCSFGECAIKQGATCSAPYADCDGISLTGCETDTTSSAAHCGGCAQPCGAADLCQASQCVGSPYMEIIAGQYYVMVRRAGGLIGWGNSAYSELGTKGTVSTPARIGVIESVTQISGGYIHACMRQGGVASCWGSDAYGKLGNGGGNVEVPVPTPVLGITTAAKVAAGTHHSCAILEDKTVWCWGRSLQGQLGHSATPPSNENAPVQVQGISDAVDVSLNDLTTCVLHEDSTVSCFGSSSEGRLGMVATEDANFPVKVSGLTQVSRLATTAGNNANMCAVLKTGGVSCWGGNANGNLGNGSTSAAWAPTTFQGVSNAKGVSMGQYHTCVVEVDGDVLCAGNNDVGQLGFAKNSANFSTPIQVDLQGAKASAIAAGRRHTCAILQSGAVICWGGNQYGQVGNGMTSASNGSVIPPFETLATP